MDRLEVARRLESQTSPRWAVTFTILDDAADRAAAHEAGADGFISTSDFRLQFLALLQERLGDERGGCSAGVESSP